MHPVASWARNRFHYAWIAIAVTFLIMLVTAGIRATPSVMMVPLERSFGWTRTTIMLRSTLGTYTVATMISGGLCVISALLILRVNRPSYTAAVAAG